VHRIGRTGRAGKTGIAVTLVDWDELARWTMIDKALGLGCPDPSETYSSSPHLYTELDIPTDARGTVGTPRKSQAKRATSGQRDGDRSEPRSRNRQRQRTRGGKSVTGHPIGGQAAGATNGEATASVPPAAGTTTANSGDGAHNGRRRRRRPRKSAGVAANAN